VQILYNIINVIEEEHYMDKDKKEEIIRFAREMGERLPIIKTQEELKALTETLTKITVERALNAELDYHLETEEEHNSRNGYSKKTIQTEDAAIELTTPRDRNSTFEPALIRKGQRRFTSMDDKILALYARGMTTRDIVDAFKEMYNADISPALISRVTEAVIEEVHEWQNRPLDEIYPVLYLDCIVVKVRQDKRVINKSVYLALAVTLEGKKDLLGLWLSENEGAKFWLSVLTELQNRGVKEIFVASVDGLSGFPDAINTVFPSCQVQLCIVHLMRNSLKYVSYKDRKAVSADLKRIYTSITADEGERELSSFSAKWGSRYGAISGQWERNWSNIIPLFDYPDEIRKIIYTTNAIESLNSVIRKAINNRKIFPDDASALKVIYLAVKQASRRWTMPIREWKPALNRFMMERNSK
jgi:transposase-like protein